MPSKSVTFLDFDFRLSRGNVATYCRRGGSLCVYREFSRKSVGERILKIGPHLPKLLSKIKGFTFFGTQCYSITNTEDTEVLRKQKAKSKSKPDRVD